MSLQGGITSFAASMFISLVHLLAPSSDEMDADEDIIAVQAEYIKLAETLWNGTEPLAPAPLPDREIFELLGFD